VDIRRPVKTALQVEEERNAKLSEGIALLKEALTLTVQEAGSRRGRKTP